MIRRLAAIATWVLLLHLNLVASDLACATHHETAGAATATAMPHHSSASPTRMADSADSESAPCKVPTRTDCCTIMASCAVNVGLGVATHGGTPATVAVIVAAVDDESHTSPTRAPETPPPKV